MRDKSKGFCNVLQRTQYKRQVLNVTWRNKRCFTSGLGTYLHIAQQTLALMFSPGYPKALRYTVRVKPHVFADIEAKRKHAR